MLALRNYPANFILVFVLIILSSVTTLAQEKTDLDENLTQSVSDTDNSTTAYYYPEFRKGQVTFISGTSNTGIINYNVLNENIEFITSKKDTLVFDEMYLVDMIMIGNDTFYYDIENAFVLKLLNTTNGRKLLVKEQPENLTTTLNSLSAAKTYFISNKADYIPVTTSNLVKLFPAHAASLQGYIENNHLKLASAEEINQLLQYAVSLK